MLAELLYGICDRVDGGARKAFENMLFPMGQVRSVYGPVYGPLYGPVYGPLYGPVFEALL